MQANKNGYFYVIDRITGEFISASPFAPHELVGGDGQEDGPAFHPSARVLRHRAGDDLPGPDRRAQLVADVVQSADRARCTSRPTFMQFVHLHGESDDVRLQGRWTQHRHRSWQRAGASAAAPTRTRARHRCHTGRAVRAADDRTAAMARAAAC